MTKKEVCGSEGAAEELTEKEFETFERGAKQRLLERRRKRLNGRLARTNLTEERKEAVRQKSGLWRANK